MHERIDDIDFDPTPKTRVANADTDCAQNDWLDPDCGSDASADMRSLSGLRKDANLEEVEL